MSYWPGLKDMAAKITADGVRIDRAPDQEYNLEAP